MELKQRNKSKINAWEWNARLSKNEYTERRITFGRYMGTMVKDIPIDYIKWGITNFKNGAWAEMFARELQRREPKWRK